MAKIIQPAGRFRSAPDEHSINLLLPAVVSSIGSAHDGGAGPSIGGTGPPAQSKPQRMDK